MSKTNNNIDNFASLLVAIQKNDSNTRKAINLAFHASMRDLFNSKSTERLNQFTGVVSGMSHWGKVKQAISIFTGGTVVEFGVTPARYLEPDRSCVRFSTKGKTWEILPQDANDWEAKKTEYTNVFAKCDYDCVPAKNRPSEGLNLEALRKQAEKLHANRDKWDKKQAKEIEAVLAALAGVLKGFQVSIDTEQTLLQPNADITGKPTGKQAA